MREYTRVDFIRNIVDPLIKNIEDEEIKRCAYVHLYGTGLAAGMLSLKRGLSRKEAELMEIAGILHDLDKFINDYEEDHAHKGSILAESLLIKADCFTEDEIKIIKQACFNHSDKEKIDNIYDEIIKDADDFQHFFRNPVENYWCSKDRVSKLCNELGIKINLE